MAMPGPIPASTDLGLGDMLSQQVAGETEEQRKKRMAEIAAAPGVGPGRSLAVTSLFGMRGGRPVRLLIPSSRSSKSTPFDLRARGRPRAARRQRRQARRRVMSVLAHNFDEAMPVLLRAGVPRLRGGPRYPRRSIAAPAKVDKAGASSPTWSTLRPEDKDSVVFDSEIQMRDVPQARRHDEAQRPPTASKCSSACSAGWSPTAGSIRRWTRKTPMPSASH
jgi:hypothetical protein